MRDLWFLAAVAVLLLAGIFLRHDSSFVIAAVTDRAPRDIFHIAGGLLEIELLAIIMVLLYLLIRFVPTNIHTQFWYALAQLVCFIGIIEGLMVSGCTMFLREYPPPGVTVCTHVTGWEIGWWVKGGELIALAALVVLYTWNLFHDEES